VDRTGGTSPFGAFGYNPEGIRIGQDAGGSRSAVKVWDERTFRNLDGESSSTRATSRSRCAGCAASRARACPRSSTCGTIEGTARNAGWLDLKLQPERRNRVKVLLFLDVGGSMDPHVRVCEELFSAAKAEFRHLEYFYFHTACTTSCGATTRAGATNALPRSTSSTRTPGLEGDLRRRRGDEPYELVQSGGSVEYANDEAGIVWLSRIFDHFRRVVWWNPSPSARGSTHGHAGRPVGARPRMFPLTLSGIAQGIDALRH